MRHRFYIDLLIKAALLYTVLLIGLSALHVLAPARDGLVALTQIFAPYLFLPLVPMLPLAFLNGTGPLKLVLLTCGLIFCLRFGPSLLSWPAHEDPNATRVEVMTWNVYRYNRQLTEIQHVLTTTPAKVIALHELSTQQARMIANDRVLAQRYPQQILRPRNSRAIGLLSVYPILEYGTLKRSDTLWAQLDLGAGQTLMVVLAHPPSGDFSLPDSRPISFPASLSIARSFDPERRNHDLKRVRALIDLLLQRGKPLLVLGDFNLTDREPAYHELTVGLRDAHREVGLGTGNTWRPFKRWSFGLLRIDYLLSNPDAVPLHTSVDCTPRGSDHCILRGTFEVQ